MKGRCSVGTGKNSRQDAKAQIAPDTAVAYTGYEEE